MKKDMRLNRGSLQDQNDTRARVAASAAVHPAADGHLAAAHQAEEDHDGGARRRGARGGSGGV